MNRQTLSFRKILPLFSLCLGASSISLALETSTEIQVTLFGQTCLLSGPYSKETLKDIHSISPEQMHPLNSLSDLQKSKKKVEKIKELPSGLKSYLNLLNAHLDARMAFEMALRDAKTSKDPGMIKQAVTAHLKPKSGNRFLAQVSKLSKDLKAEEVLPLRDLYLEGIEPNPEEEFHRAIRKLNVHYVCALE